MARRKPILPAAPLGTASLYVRLSREARETNLSLEGMLDDVRRHAAQLGLTVVAEHIDDGLSGAIRNRPAFVAWLDDVRECRASTIIAWHVDRMTREGVNVAALILDAVEGKDPEDGKVIRTPARLVDTKGLDSTGDETSFRLRFVIAAEVARAERERMRDRARASKRRLAAAGRWGGGPPPYGFRTVPAADGVGRVLEVHPEEAALIREAAVRVLAGAAPGPVCRWANGPEGRPPRRARQWARNALVQVLTGAPVAGPILTADESAAVRQRLQATPSPSRGIRTGGRMLSGILVCHSCLEPLRIGRGGVGNKHTLYRCATRANGGTHCAHPVAITAPVVEAYIESDYLERYGTSVAYKRVAEVTGAAAVQLADEAKHDALAALAEAPTAENFAILQSAQVALDEALAIPQTTTVGLVPTGRTVAEEWAVALDPRDRRDLLAASLGRIILRPAVRGANRFDPGRLVIIDNPPTVLGATDPAVFRPGAIVVEE